VNGLTVYVPPAYTRQSQAVLPDPEAAQKMKDADIILEVVGTGLSEACRQELNTSRAIRKPTILIAHPLFAPQLQPYFGPNLIVVDPANPDRAELGIVQHLRTVEAEQKAKKALIALGTLALGLSIFAPQD